MKEVEFYGVREIKMRLSRSLFGLEQKNEGERAKNHEEKIGDKKLHGYYLVTGR